MKRSLLGPIAVLTAGAFIFVGCGGGGTSVPATKPAAAQATTASGGTGTAQFLIHIPAKTASSAARKPAYVSANTGSVSFTTSGTTTTVALTPGSATCPADTTSAGGYDCTAEAHLPAGTNIQLTISTFASANGSGTPLSTNVVTVPMITANTANPLMFTLNGVVSSFTVAYSSTQLAVGTASNIMATVTAKDASGATIVGSGTLVDANNNPLTITSTDTSGAIGTISGPASGVFTIPYTGAAAKSPTFTAALGTMTASQFVRIDSAVVNGDFTVASTTSNTIGAPWYSCSAAHTNLAAPVSPSPVPSPIQSQAPGSTVPSPFPASPSPYPVSLQSSVPSGAVGTVSGGYSQYAMIENSVVPKAYKGSFGICQDITIPSGTPSLNLQLLEGGDDSFASTDTEATLYATPVIVSTPHPDGVLITTAPVATLFAEDNCWDNAAWEPIFLGSSYGGTGTSTSTIGQTSRFAACPETPGGQPPYHTAPYFTSMGGFWYTKTLAIPAVQIGGSYTLFLGIWRSAASSAPALSTNGYYSWSYFTGVNIH